MKTVFMLAFLLILAHGYPVDETERQLGSLSDFFGGFDQGTADSDNQPGNGDSVPPPALAPAPAPGAAFGLNPNAGVFGPFFAEPQASSPGPSASPSPSISSSSIPSPSASVSPSPSPEKKKKKKKKASPTPSPSNSKTPKQQSAQNTRARGPAPAPSTMRPITLEEDSNGKRETKRTFQLAEMEDDPAKFYDPSKLGPQLTFKFKTVYPGDSLTTCFPDTYMGTEIWVFDCGDDESVADENFAKRRCTQVATDGSACYPLTSDEEGTRGRVDNLEVDKLYFAELAAYPLTGQTETFSIMLGIQQVAEPMELQRGQKVRLQLSDFESDNYVFYDPSESGYQKNFRFSASKEGYVTFLDTCFNGNAGGTWMERKISLYTCDGPGPYFLQERRFRNRRCTPYTGGKDRTCLGHDVGEASATRAKITNLIPENTYFAVLKASIVDKQPTQATIRWDK